ncbi:probable succinate dehydrogenase/fumarate reductase, flavoprotein subunit [Phialocephala subalpina]|uniref:Probable succinate dehydrogenase/fumarate reductase, flavoprotein subunit n=1 Tax=Phialocephala subalpina TaxID=576137 RepID=A0A1L7XN92_9HELO|nr:probable succinate dehydrogenase/fumarate reductase, flavoprotein subunit [Phialocephala subalpina]
MAQPRTNSTVTYDVLVVGGGNAGFCSAISAAQSGAKRVLLIDKCPRSWAGGNSHFTAGAFRTVHAGLSDILPLVNNVDFETASQIDLESYTKENFLNDLSRMTTGRFEPELGKALIEESLDAVKWLAKNGVRFQLSFNRQAYKIDGRFKFWGGMCLKTEDGGKGLIVDHQQAAKRAGVTVFYSTAAKGIILDPKTGAFKSLLAEDQNGRSLMINAKAVILAAGGFESNPRMRSQYLGPGWDLAHVRGTPYNTGECLEMAIRDISAKQAGQWSGCHSVAWDANSPANSGDREISNEFTKSGYPLGITLNTQGERFFDEGSDIRNYTYAKFGRAILAQPQSLAFQIWDSQGIAWLRDEEYRPEIVERINASTIEKLAQTLAKSHGLSSPDNFVRTVKAYNEAVYAHRKENAERGLKWDPAVKDGLSTQSSRTQLKVPKSNWALPLDQGPFMAVKVGCGVTFTFGGLAVDPKTSGVISLSGKAVAGVFCAGEMVGGLFYDNYPGGSGLTSGAVFGRKAGINAAAVAAREISSKL